MSEETQWEIIYFATGLLLGFFVSQMLRPCMYTGIGCM